jgi:cytosine/adenosine deaminase-related metal-dependent hydrolase
VGRADIGKALALGVPAALGTDSLASNTDLDLFREAAFVLEHFPDVPPGGLLRTMTGAGAVALGRGKRFGTLSPGACGGILAVEPDGSPAAADELAGRVILQGAKGAWQWIEPPTDG